MIKHKIILAILAIGLASVVGSAQNPDRFTLRISAKGAAELNGTTVYLTDQQSGKVIDSLLYKGKSITFSGAAQPVRLLTVRAGNYRLYAVGEPAMLRGDLKNDDFAEGSPLNAEGRRLMNTLKAEKATLQKEVEALAEKNLSEDAAMEAFGRLQEIQTEFTNGLLSNCFKKHSNDALGAYALEALSYSLPPEEFLSLYEQSGTRIKEYESLRQVARAASNTLATSDGKPFTNIIGVNPADTASAVHLADYVGKGKYVIVDFWASWCGPCRRAIPELKEVYARYHEKGLEIVGVSVWDKYDDNVKAVGQMEIPWPIIFDDTRTKCAETYGVRGIPTILLIDKAGTIISRSLHGKELADKLADLFADPAEKY